VAKPVARTPPEGLSRSAEDRFYFTSLSVFRTGRCWTSLPTRGAEPVGGYYGVFADPDGYLWQVASGGEVNSTYAE
jgi:hypothetical protein